MDNDIKINSNEMIKDLQDIQQEMNNTENVINNANDRSSKSFLVLNEVINTIQQSYVSMSLITNTVVNSVNNITTAITNMTSALMFSIETLNIHQIAFGLQKDMIDSLSESMIIYNGMIDVNSQLSKDNTDASVNSSKETEKWNFCQIALTASTATLTAACEALTIMQLLHDKQSRAEIVTGAKFIASLAKQTAALIAKGIAAIASWVASNPLLALGMGVAIAGTIALTTNAIKKSTITAMATGGVVSSPTMALVGEGRYPEAVVPLGESPQFANMKADIANAVIQGMNANNAMRSIGKQKNLILQLNIDGRQFAEATISDFVEALNNEGYGVLRADAMFR